MDPFALLAADRLNVLLDVLNVLAEDFQAYLGIMHQLIIRKKLQDCFELLHMLVVLELVHLFQHSISFGILLILELDLEALFHLVGE